MVCLILLGRSREAPDCLPGTALRLDNMALAAVVLSLGACREGWTQLGSRCIHATAPVIVESECAAKCASVGSRPWVANDTGIVTEQMCIKSQDEYDFLHTWVVNQAEANGNGAYWTGFRRLGTSDGVTPPADWRTAMVHPQGSACSAGTNPWFDSLISHDGARSLLEHGTVHSQHPISVLHVHVCTAAMQDHPVWNINEPGDHGGDGDDAQCTQFSDEHNEQNCIVRETDRWHVCDVEQNTQNIKSEGYWCVETRPEQTARQRQAEQQPILFPVAAGGLQSATSAIRRLGY